MLISRTTVSASMCNGSEWSNSDHVTSAQVPPHATVQPTLHHSNETLCFPIYCPWLPPIILHHYLTSSAPYLHPCRASDPLTTAIRLPHIQWPTPQVCTLPTRDQLCHIG